jgi:hypothetical protein
MSNLSCTSKKVLPVFYLCVRYIEGRRYLATCYPTYFRALILFRRLPCLHSYSFLSIYAHNAYMYRYPQQPAKFISPQLWTPITFFWLGIFAPYFGKVLKYRYILTSRSLLFFCAVEKNHIFYEHPLPKSVT